MNIIYFNLFRPVFLAALVMPLSSLMAEGVHLIIGESLPATTESKIAQFKSSSPSIEAQTGQNGEIKYYSKKSYYYFEKFDVMVMIDEGVDQKISRLLWRRLNINSKGNQDPEDKWLSASQISIENEKFSASVAIHAKQLTNSPKVGPGSGVGP